MNRILLFDLDRLFFWRIPPMMLVGLAGWFLAAFAFDVGIMSRGVARAVAAAAAIMFLSSVHRCCNAPASLPESPKR